MLLDFVIEIRIEFNVIGAVSSIYLESRLQDLSAQLIFTASKIYFLAKIITYISSACISIYRVGPGGFRTLERQAVAEIAVAEIAVAGKAVDISIEQWTVE